MTGKVSAGNVLEEGALRSEEAGPERLGLFGGSFDPIHRGHVDPVLEARDQLGLDRVLYLPTASPPHKPERKLAAPWSRFAMVELALLRLAGLEAHPHELTLGRPAYTVETLEFFRLLAPQAELFLLVGQDSFEALPTWRRGLEIPQLAQVGVLRRPGSDNANDASGAPNYDTPVALEAAVESGRVHFIDNSPCPWSSTVLRSQLFGRREDVRLAFDPLVLDYIDKYELYE